MACALRLQNLVNIFHPLQNQERRILFYLEFSHLLKQEQLNLLFSEPRITGFVEISVSGKLIVKREDGLARMIGFSDHEIIWFDSYSEPD
jgi:hypothetical protein